MECTAASGYRAIFYHGAECTAASGYQATFHHSVEFTAASGYQATFYHSAEFTAASGHQATSDRGKAAMSIRWAADDPGWAADEPSRTEAIDVMRGSSEHFAAQEAHRPGPSGCLVP